MHDCVDERVCQENNGVDVCVSAGRNPQDECGLHWSGSAGSCPGQGLHSSG